ncbi:hypothetical protein BDP81DRAFT_441045 [Colletotrichum phormii]|uniref:Uncharacterized protein n=1 Tax=Colletotrichum phormii TaxID=359342 RepID=A0AAI9ZDN6_9PEZI|nr:uncharacterized protein BDP81DRAFT_441045 [Colletotrichum phormii]KAK1622624.1 hypothetical protein BDP81DRAFT_441045 [Colletotrichum phormii]
MATAAAIGANAGMMTVLTSNITSEAVSNGVWLEVLQHHFPPNRFTIAPEQNNQAGRADLTVFFMYNDNNGNLCWDPIFTLEGKTPGVHITQAHIIQASGYVRTLSSANLLNGRKFGMLVAGQEVVLLVNNGGVQSTQWDRADTNINQYNPGTPFNVWGIQGQGNMVDGFLADFAQKF